MPFKRTATKVHAVVNEIQLNSSVFSSFLNIVKDKDGSLRTGCRLFQPLGQHKKSTRANGLGRRRRYEEVAVCSGSQMTTSRERGDRYCIVQSSTAVRCCADTCRPRHMSLFRVLDPCNSACRLSYIYSAIWTKWPRLSNPITPF